MSFNFEIKLTAPQIAVLLYFVKVSQGKKAATLPKGTSISSVRALVTDGILEVEKAPVGSSTKWRVTRKGFILAELINEEIKTIKIPRSDTNFLFWYDMPKGSITQTGIAGSMPGGEILV